MPLLAGMRSRRRRRALVCLPAVLVAVLAAGGVTPRAGRAASSVPPGTPAGYSVAGIDVSAYEGAVDWQAVKATGVRFAYIRASEQANTPDARYVNNYANAKAQGLFVGAYHRARPDLSGGKAQGDYLLDQAQFTNDGKTLPPVVDMEWPRAGWTGRDGKPLDSCYDMTASQLVGWTRAFLAEVSARTGRAAVVYTSTSWWNLCTKSASTFGENPLWVARYGTSPLPLPAGWRNFAFWQYTSTGKLPSGAEVDQDVFREDPAALAWLAQGTPVALSSWVDHTYQHVVYASADGHIHALYFPLGGGRWHQSDLTAGAGAPPAIRGTALTSWVDEKYQHVAYISADLHAHELYVRLGSGSWKQNDLTVAAGAAPAAPGSALSSWVDHNYQHVVYASADRHIRELYFWLAGGAWRQTDLSETTGAPPAVPGNALTSWVAGRYQHVVYLSVDGHTRELSFPIAGGAWKQADLTDAVAAPPAALGSALSSWINQKYQHAVSLGTDRHLRELYAPAAGDAWKQTDLTTSAGASSALPGTVLSSWIDQKYQHLVYLSANQHIHELYFPLAGGHWKQNDLTSTASCPAATLGSALTSWVDHNYQHVVYITSDGHAHELYYPLAGGRWKQNDLTASAGAPPALSGSG